MATPALVAAVAQLDQQVKHAQKPEPPHQWHVWLSNEGRVWATHIKRNGLAETVDADTPSKMLNLLTDLGVRL